MHDAPQALPAIHHASRDWLKRPPPAVREVVVPTESQIAGDLAAALLGGAWTRRSLSQRMARFLRNKAARANAGLLGDVLDSARSGYPPSPASLTAAILASRWFPLASIVLRRSKAPVSGVLTPPRFYPAPGGAVAGAPEIETPGDLAAWLGVSLSRLTWLADDQSRHDKTATPMFQNYRYRFLQKASGAMRLIECPKPQLRALQIRILRDILDRAPVHDAAHGFVKGRSCKTGAAIHVRESVVACLDIRDFFGSVRPQRVHAVFRRMGYPWAVARLLSGLCTTMTPASVFARAPDPVGFDWETRKRFGAPHLPQGAPTSPALANFVVAGMDRRLDGLARRCGGRYTRYADDITFSGDNAFARRIEGFLARVADIVRDEGFSVNQGKTRVMRRGGRQSVNGLVVNDGLNVPRRDYDALKAILHNCATHGPESQNRQGHANFASHLAGRVAWVESVNAARGARLRAVYDRIVWA